MKPGLDEADFKEKRRKKLGMPSEKHIGNSIGSQGQSTPHETAAGASLKWLDPVLK
jgi:hypothetical protein